MNGRFVTAFSLLFLAACAVPTATAPALARWSDAAEPAASTAPGAAGEPGLHMPGPATPYRIGARDNYTIAKLGSFMPAGDIDSLDDGFAAEILFGHKLIPLLSIEGSVGYLTADGAGNANLTAIPLFVNGRVSLPIAIFELYGGLGIGGLYADYEFGSFSETDFVLAGQAFIGASVGLGNLALGLEYKYLETEDTKDNFAIEGGIASIFISLPF